jgi:hypothetical protein
MALRPNFGQRVQTPDFANHRHYFIGSKISTVGGVDNIDFQADTRLLIDTRSPLPVYFIRSTT